MSVKAHRTTGAQTTELGLHNGELVPTDEGVGVVEENELPGAARRPRTGANVTPNSTKSASLESKLRSPCNTQVPGRPPSGGKLGPFRVKRSVSKRVTP